MWSASDVRGLGKADRTQLLQVAQDEWFAFVIHEADQFLVVYNPSMSLRRRNAVIMHELWRIVLGHDLPAAQQTDDGHFMSGNYSHVQEAEADWLAGTSSPRQPYG